MDKTAYNRALKDLYKQNVQGKTIAHPESGDISFYKNGAGKTIYENGGDYEQLSVLPQIDEIVGKSKFQYNEPLNKVRNDDIQNFDILKGRANIDGNVIDTDIHIANTPDGKKFYFNKRPDIETSELHPYGNQLPIPGTNIIADNEAYFNSVSPLSLQGIKEAIEAGKVLKEKGYTFDIAYTSVLKRANRTLELILKELDLDIPIKYSWRLNERHYGALQGLNKDETR